MKVIKTNNIAGLLKLAAVATILFMGGNLYAAETEKKQQDVKAEKKVSADKKNNQTGQGRNKNTPAFKPTEEVSADQAVAFPTDI